MRIQKLHSKFIPEIQKRLIRPFVLVVAKDTNHAKEIRTMIESDRFFEGRYKGKVIEVHSNQRGEEKKKTYKNYLT